MALRVIKRGFAFRMHRVFSSARPEGEATEPSTQKSEASSQDSEAAISKSPEQVKIEELTADLAKSKNQTLTVMADADNMRKRMIIERENERTYAISKFANELLDVSDNLQRAVEAIDSNYLHLEEVEGVEKVLKDLITGVSMTRDILMKTFQKFDVQEYNPMGEKFNPDIHEALYTFPDPKREPNTVGNVINSGFMIGQRVLRPAKVGIVKN